MTFDWSFAAERPVVAEPRVFQQLFGLGLEKAAIITKDYKVLKNNMWLLPFCFILMINGQEISMETESQARMTFTPPTLSDEDKHLIHMPNYLLCDGCKAVSYSLHKAFEDRHKQRKDQEWKMKEGDVLEIFGKSFYVVL